MAIVEHEPGRRLVASKNVTAGEEFFQGHFPGSPLMPGVQFATIGDLQESLDTICDAANARGLEIMAAGTHPFSHWQDQEVSPQERYRDLVERIQWPARRMATYGTHFHVGVRGPGKVIPINNSLAAHLPLFLALSAASPYWHGLDSGMASCRTKVFESLPTAGLPFHFQEWAEFEAFAHDQLTTGVIDDLSEIKERAAFDVARLFARGNPHLGAQECAAYDAPFPDAGHRAAYAERPRSRPMGAGLDLRGRRKDGSIPDLVHAHPNETVADAVHYLREFNVSQMPVVRAEPPVMAAVRVPPSA